MPHPDARALDEARRFYAEEIRFVADLERDEVAQVFSRVPRERFLGPPPWKMMTPRNGYRDVAGGDPRDTYHNVVFAMDPRRLLNNGLPSFVARLIDESGARAGDHAVHVGCGSGYYTAIFAELVGETGHVTAIEIDDDLAVRARANLAGWPWVDLRHADGTRFDPGAANAIFVNAGATHPKALWIDRLLPGATLILPLTVETKTLGVGHVLKVTHTPKGLAARFVSPVGIYPCVGARDEEHNRRLARAFAQGNDELAKVQSLRRDAHVPGDGCWLHDDEFCLSTLALG